MRAFKLFMLKHLFHTFKTSPVSEVFLRFKAVYSLMDQRGRQTIILLQLNYILGVLLGTIAMGGMAAFLIVLSQPEIILDNHYIAMVYNGLGFEKQSYFLILLVTLLVLLLSMQQIIQAVSGVLGVRLTEALGRRCSVMLYRYYLAETYERHLEMETSKMASKVLGVGRGVVTNQIQTSCSFASATINAVLISAALIAMDASSAIALLFVVVLFYSGFFFSYRRRNRRVGEEMYKQSQHRATAAREGMAAAIEIKMMGKEKNFIEEVNVSLLRDSKIKVKQAIMNSIPNPSIRIIMMISVYLVAINVFLGSTPGRAFGILALFAAGVFRILPSLQSIYGILMDQESGSYTYKEIISDLKKARRYAEEIEENDNKFEPIRVKSGIVFENVTYSYPGADKPAVSGMNFSMSPNKTVALLGCSGVGKTTAIRLMSGLLIPQNGRVLVNGKSLSSDKSFRRNWQKSSGVTFQRPFFMDASIAMNVAFECSTEKIDYGRLQESIKLAQLEDLVATLPDGLDTDIMEGAEKLSGGQRQRLAIARALYRDSSILIFDEATNALDLVVEKVILETLTNLQEDRVIIIIAHRPETIRFADEFLLLKQDGSLVQGNCYDELFEKDAHFRELVGGSELMATG